MNGPAAGGGAWAGARHVLCVRLDNMGDVVMCTPAVRALRESAPGRRLTLLASPAGAAAAQWIPELDEAIPYAAPWMKATAAPAPAEDARLAATLRARQFDAAVIFTSFSQSALPAALLCHWAGIPRRLAHCRENPYHLLTDWVPDPEPQLGIRHEVERQLALVAHIGCSTPNQALSFAPTAADHARVRERLRHLGLAPHAPFIVAHPGASAASRRYPAGHWPAVLRALAAAPGYPILLTGSAAEAPLHDAILTATLAPAGALRPAACAGTASVPAPAASAPPGAAPAGGPGGGPASARGRGAAAPGAGAPRILSLAGTSGLGELAALIAQSALLIANNTGPVHLAAAVGTPVVDLYALTNPQHTPWHVPHIVLNHDVPCRNCYKSICPQGHHACLARLPPDAVIAAARQLLHDRGPPHRQPAGPR